MAVSRPCVAETSEERMSEEIFKPKVFEHILNLSQNNFKANLNQFCLTVCFFCFMYIESVQQRPF